MNTKRIAPRRSTQSALRVIFPQKAFNSIQNGKIYAFWVLLFIGINVFIPTEPGTNPYSRYAALEALVNDSSLIINKYQNWTIDWSQNNDGNYFSNKAPGPLFLGAPIYFALDKLFKKNNNGQPTRGARVVFCLFTQVLPMAFIVFLFTILLMRANSPPVAIHFMILSILFGNTASLFTNVYFGHAMAATLVLATVYVLIHRRIYWSGLFFGVALLTEYPCAFILIPILIYFHKINISKKEALYFIAGGIIPGVLWAFYHYYAFGGIFQLPQSFNNPQWATAPSDTLSLWGSFPLTLNINVIFELLFGSTRGLLITQPWVLLALFLIVKNIKNSAKHSYAEVYLLIAFLLFLLMNQSYLHWHAGWTAGPRYLAAVLPLFGLYIAFIYKELHRISKYLLWAGLIYSVLFKGLVMGTTILAPEQFILLDYLSMFLFQPGNPDGIYIFMGFSAIIFVTLIVVYLTNCLPKERAGSYKELP